MSIEETAKEIKKLMVENDLKAKDVAEILGKSKEWVSRLISPQNLLKHQQNALEDLKRHQSTQNIDLKEQK